MSFGNLRAGAVSPTSEILKKLVAPALVLGLVLAGGARAHHGFDARYSLAAPIWIEGVVVEAYFGHPHSELTVRVSNDIALPAPPPDLGPAASFLDAEALTIRKDIIGRTVVLELPPTSQYSSLGGRIGKADRIAAVAVRNCESPHQLNVQWLQLPDGKVESRTGAMSYMVERC
jgi:hypothetical protein